MERHWLLCLLITTLVASTMAADEESQQRAADRVINLPGQPPVPFQHYSGYIQLQTQNEKSMFYWFFEAQTEPALKPIVIWLHGGPGCSSVAFGAAQEIGPFLVRRPSYFTNRLTFNEYSWNKVANVLFLESPVSVGFSYTNNSNDLLEIGDQVVANDTLAFLLGWFKRFPDFKSHDFYIIGESYGGHYAPQLADLIYETNKGATQDSFINLKGFMMGNAVINDQTDTLGIVDYAWSHGIISDKLYQSLKADCDDFKLPHTSSQCNDQLKAFFDAFFGIDIFNVYSPVCVLNFSTTTTSSNLEDVGFEIPSTFDPCVNNYVRKYFNQKEVQRALHANVTNLPYPYTLCSSQLSKWIDSPTTVLPTISKLLDAGMRIWTYSGDADARVPVTSTRYSITKLGLPVMEEWRPWFYKRQVAGWVETYGKGLTLATIRGGGHEAALSARDWSLSLFTNFLSNTSLPSSSF
ncbi:hypothetical protein Patl1_23515 [Pistacia atlantica]|uniref:Uncharacterized protein n=1 Tax=Pistacia atlantica TaxID=434234 RepID=A0ACC1A078_9ROSI|nr:hypothetical protein Patl1_23515 [Pistacia atlantica]